MTWISFLVRLPVSGRVAKVIPSIRWDDFRRHIGVREYDSRKGSPSSPKPYLPGSRNGAVHKGESCLVRFWVPCLSCYDSAYPWPSLLSDWPDPTILFHFQNCYLIIYSYTYSNFNEHACSSYLVDWSSIAENKVYRALDITFLEEMSAFAIEQRVLCAVEATAIKGCFVRLKPHSNGLCAFNFRSRFRGSVLYRKQNCAHETQNVRNNTLKRNCEEKWFWRSVLTTKLTLWATKLSA